MNNSISYIKKYIEKSRLNGTDKKSIRTELENLFMQFPHLEQTLRHNHLVAQYCSC